VWALKFRIFLTSSINDPNTDSYLTLKGEKMTRIDPVCNMQIDEKKAAGKSQYKGQTYYFCSAACKSEFDQDPEQYAGQNTGSQRGAKVGQS
jgi:Cu+-exporting ATPase